VAFGGIACQKIRLALRGGNHGVGVVAGKGQGLTAGRAFVVLPVRESRMAVQLVPHAIAASADQQVPLNLVICERHYLALKRR